MGCDIHIYAEKKGDDGKYHNLPGDLEFNANYGVFGFLAGVRNYSAVTPISEPRGIPDDASETVKEEFIDWEGDAHSESWLAVSELTEFDYGQLMEDRRVMKQIGINTWSGQETCEPGHGFMMTYRDFLGLEFFKLLAALQAYDADRIVFWFDS